MAAPRDHEHGKGAQAFFERNEQIRLERLRQDGRRPKAELLEETIRLSAFAVGLSRGARSTRG